MPTFLTSAQVCDLLQIHDNTLHRMVDDGRLPAPVKLTPARNGRRRFPADETLAAIERMRQPVAA